MAKVIWSEWAMECLEQIGSFLAERNPPAAFRTLRGIVERVELVATHPRMGGRLPDVEPREVRLTLYGKHRIYYEVGDADTVYVLAIIHGASDFDTRSL